MHRLFVVGLATTAILSGCARTSTPTERACSRVLAQVNIFGDDIGRLAVTPEGPTTQSRIVADTALLKAYLTDLRAVVPDRPDQSTLKRYWTLLAWIQRAIAMAGSREHPRGSDDLTGFVREISGLDTRIRAMCK